MERTLGNESYQASLSKRDENNCNQVVSRTKHNKAAKGHRFLLMYLFSEISVHYSCYVLSSSLTQVSK